MFLISFIIGLIIIFIYCNNEKENMSQLIFSDQPTRANILGTIYKQSGDINITANEWVIFKHNLNSMGKSIISDIDTELIYPIKFNLKEETINVTYIDPYSNTFNINEFGATTIINGNLENQTNLNISNNLFNNQKNRETAGYICVGNELKVNGNLQNNGRDLVPLGLIVPWYNFGKSDTPIPSGWALCDGLEHDGVRTVDLRNQFVFGDSDSLKGKVGEAEIKITKENMPEHFHTIKEGATSHNFLPIHNHPESYGLKGSNLDDDESQPYSIMWEGLVGYVDRYTKPTVVEFDGHIHEDGVVRNFTSNYGSVDNKPRNNMPSYMVLYFIQKIR